MATPTLAVVETVSPVHDTDSFPIDWPERWRWMKHRSVVRKLAVEADRRRPRTLSSWRWKYAVIAGPGASGCDTFPMSRARVWSALSERSSHGAVS